MKHSILNNKSLFSSISIELILKTNKNYDEDYLLIVQDILNSEVFLSTEKFIQHGNTSVFKHCLNVSFYSYLIAKKLNLDVTSVARAGLLHDLFLYDWHINKTTNKPLFEKHGFTHPKIAYNNAKKHFVLNSVEKDIILKHMWPLTFKLPSYKETYIIVLVDKYCSIIETFNFHIISKLKKHIENNKINYFYYFKNKI